jgi:hypothetical protein
MIEGQTFRQLSPKPVQILRVWLQEVENVVKTFLRNHIEAIAAIDMCVVPTLTFDPLFAILVLGHGRRQLLWFE